ncbi:hypothetical protein DH20_14220 [Pantoea agglomerans]|nr:hypothetical protein [Pantoea agglomerans]
MNTNFAERLKSLVCIDDGTWFVAGAVLLGIIWCSCAIIRQVESERKDSQAASWREREVRALETLARQAEKNEQGKES